LLLLLLLLLLLFGLGAVGRPFFASTDFVPEAGVVVEDGIIVLLGGREGGREGRREGGISTAPSTTQTSSMMKKGRRDGGMER